MLLRVIAATSLLRLCCGEFDWCSLTCDGGLKHSMCVYKVGGGDSCKAVKRGLTAEEKEVIVDYHNQLRAKVANGQETTGPQPTAADMNQLVWDDEVAEIAERWVDQCEQPGGHDKCRITKDKVKVGQNFAESGGYGMAVDRISMIKELVKSWYDEVKDMDPSLVGGIQFNGPVIGHYTQLVWGKTTHLGCGLAHKQEGEKGEFDIRLICNYKIAGNFIGQPVYTKGDPASKCVKNSTKYPGLCEPQEEGDKPESDDSAPISSAGDSPSVGANSESLKPVSFASSGFGKPVSAFASAGFPDASDPFYSAGDSPSFGASFESLKPVSFASSGFGKLVSAFASTGFPAAFALSGFPEDFDSVGSNHGNPSPKVGNVHQFFNSMVIPGRFSKSFPSSKETIHVNSISSRPMSNLEFQNLFGVFDRKK